MILLCYFYFDLIDLLLLFNMFNGENEMVTPFIFKIALKSMLYFDGWFKNGEKTVGGMLC